MESALGVVVLVEVGVKDVAASEVVVSVSVLVLVLVVGRDTSVMSVVNVGTGNVELPPVIVEPVIGIGVVMSVSDVVSDVVEAEVVGEAGTEMFVMEKSGLVLPESPNTTISL